MNLLRYIAAALLVAIHAPAQVTYERLLHAEEEPGSWLTYSGSYKSHRYSKLEEIHRENVKGLQLEWVFQARSLEKFEATPLVADGVMYLTQAPNDVVALDPKTGQVFWTMSYPLPTRINPCCGRVNRGVAMLGDTLYMGTLDAHLVALDAKTGTILWDVEIADYTAGYAIAVSPLVVKDKVIVGVAGGEYGIRGLLDAYNAKSGKRVWRFYTVPGPGEAGHETWAGDAWQRGGGSIWLTGSFDPELNLTYWGVGNPSPDWNAEVRPGDNLYTDSVIALNPDTGELKWHFQFTPHDHWDWDSTQVPVLVDMEFRGQPRKLMLWANRNGFFYGLDRTTGEFLQGRPFIHQTWAAGLDERGRPIVKPEAVPTPEGALVHPGVQGGTNWYSPSYSPRSGLFYVPVWEYASIYHQGDPTYTRGNRYIGSVPRAVPDDPGYGAIRALDPKTGEKKWEIKMVKVTNSGILSTAGDLIFAGNNEGDFFAADAHSGEILWRKKLGGAVYSSPISYLVDGKQRVAIAAGNALFTFGLD
jgi:alcohol dehydrogenase (cytochrome c)